MLGASLNVWTLPNSRDPPANLGASQILGRRLIFWVAPKKERASLNYGRVPEIWEGEKIQVDSRFYGSLLIIRESPKK